MILTHMIGINELLKLTQGKGHKVNGQGQIGACVKNKKIWFKNSELIDVDVTYTYHLHW